MKAGTLRHVVSLTRRTPGKDANMQPWTTFDPYVTGIYASVEPSTGKEFWAANRFIDNVDTMVTIRYMPGVKPVDRVVHGADVYEVLAVLDEKLQHKMLMLACKLVS